MGVYFNKKRKLWQFIGIVKHKIILFVTYIPYRLSAYWRKDPDFLIIGGMKCGTTFLFHYLNKHPEIQMSRIQEVNYFTRHYYRSKWFYRSFFPFKSSKKVTGESGIHYIFYPKSAARIKKDLPNAKIILLLRNPVNRAQSHYNQIKNIDEAADFSQALAWEQERVNRLDTYFDQKKHYSNLSHETYSYASRGLYFKQLSGWLEHFTLKDLLIIKSEEMFENPTETLAQVYEHIGVSPIFPKDIKPQNSRDYEIMNESDRSRLVNYFREDAEQLEALLGPKFRWNE